MSQLSQANPQFHRVTAQCKYFVVVFPLYQLLEKSFSELVILICFTMNVQFFSPFYGYWFKILISLIKGQVQEHHAVSHQGEINDMQWKILSKFSVYRSKLYVMHVHKVHLNLH